MTNMAEYGNKSHVQKNRSVFFPLCEKITIFANANMQGQRSLRRYDRRLGSPFRVVFFPGKGNG